MALQIYYSDKIEDLARHLESNLLSDRRRGDPFDLLSVTVPNTNIAKWLQIRVFAKDRGLCAGVRFPFMEQRLTELLSANLKPAERAALLPPNAYSNAIMGILLAPSGDSPEFAAFAPFRAYVTGGDGAKVLAIETRRQARMGWQLAVKLADLMDQYEVRRPEIVANWLAGLDARGERTPKLGSVEAAEAALARALWGEGGAFPTAGDRLSLRQLFDRVKDSSPSGPRRKIYFFGHSTLSVLQTKILVWLARTHEVVFYHNNVCLEYWGDIETKAERIRRFGRAHDREEDVAVENSLLQQWGVAGRETIRLLVDLEEENDGRIDFEWTCLAADDRPPPTTLLGTVQDSVRRRTSELDGLGQDASLQIVGVPGVRREVELVYNSILGSVWKPKGAGERPWPDCSFSDIAVLVPDMATYRPMIEAVFDSRGQIPYGLIDTTASEDSAYLSGFLALAELARTGLTRETLFAVLENPCVQAALGFSGSDVEAWRGLTRKLGAFDGFETNASGSAFSWAWALMRARLAQVADTLSYKGAGGGELPLAPTSGDSVLRFSEVVELLYRKVTAAFGIGEEGQSRLLPCARGRTDCERTSWARVLGGLMVDCLAVPQETAPLEGTIQRQILLTLDGLLAIPGGQRYEFVLAAVEQFVGGLACRKGGYLTHGVTIAGLMPMRPVPFRQVYILGLGANGFPGRNHSSTLDLRGSAWRLGDTSLTNVNRYLFLEMLMAVRDRLVLTYPNRDTEKDAELFPSVLVRGLKGFVERFILHAPFREFRNYPLLERGEGGADAANSPVADVVWRRDDPQAGILPTYSAVARRMMRERLMSDSPPAADESAHPPSAMPSRREVSARELAEFLRNPLKAVLRFRFGVGVEGARDTALPPDSPLGIPSGPPTWGLQNTWLSDGRNLDAMIRRLELSGGMPVSGDLPDSFLGNFARDRFKAGLHEELLPFVRGAVARGEVMRVSFPMNVRTGAATPARVRCTAEIPNWLAEGRDVTILMTGGLKNADRNPRPIHRALDGFLSFLMFVANAREAEPWHLKTCVLDLDEGKSAVWHWRTTASEAWDYLERLSARYLTYLERGAEDYADFGYDGLRDSLVENPVGGIDWKATHDRLAARSPDFRRQDGYNGNLVIERTKASFLRSPTESEVREAVEACYAFPFAAEKEEVSA